jgi:hypothetical protein
VEAQVSFKRGDMVIVIYVEGALYPADARPGTIATIEHPCSHLCSLLLGMGRTMWTIATATRSVCAAESVLRKIDGEGREVVKWDTVPWQPERAREPA